MADTEREDTPLNQEEFSNEWNRLDGEESEEETDLKLFSAAQERINQIILRDITKLSSPTVDSIIDVLVKEDYITTEEAEDSNVHGAILEMIGRALESAKFQKDEDEEETHNIDSEDDSPRHNYGSSEYWDRRYENDQESFDWLLSWNDFKQGGCTKYIPDGGKVLIVGSGNADFSADMYDDGHQDVWNIDLSSVVIEQMRKKNESRTNMQWLHMDATKMTFPDCTFDVAIDKSTMDCLFCCTNSTRHVFNMTAEVNRILKVGGYYICISLHEAGKVLEHIENRPDLDWEITWFNISNPRFNGDSGRTESHSVVVARKRNNSSYSRDESDEENTEVLSGELAKDAASERIEELSLQLSEISVRPEID